MNKLFRLCLAPFIAAFFLCALCSQVYAAEETATELITGSCGAKTDTDPNGENVKYTISDDGTKLTISGSGAMADYSSSPFSAYKSTLTTLVFEDGSNITHIGNYAFYGLNLGEVIIPNTVTSIGKSAFCYCQKLTSISIPSSVTSIGTNHEMAAFTGCHSLTAINVSSENANYMSLDGVLFSKDGLTLLSFPGHKSGDYAIPDGVTTIGEYAFFGVSASVNLTIPKSVDIRSCAFENFVGLKSVVISKGITRIGYYAFEDCPNLASIVIPSSVTSIDGAFYNSGLISVEIPYGVEAIGDYTFYSCTQLESVIIPDSVTTLGDSAFGSCTSLTEVTIPSSVKTIGNDAFAYCTALTSITIPEGVETIGSNAFKNCTALTSINIPYIVKRIDSTALTDCTNLTSINISTGDIGEIETLLSSCTSITEIPELTLLNEYNDVAASTLSKVKRLRCFKDSEADMQDISSYTSIEKVHIQDQSSAQITIPKPTNGQWIQKVELIITKGNNDKPVELTQYKEDENGDYIFPVVMYANSYLNERSLPCKARYYYSYVNGAATEQQLAAAAQGGDSDNTSAEAAEGFSVYWREITLDDAEFAITEEGLIDEQQ